MDAPTQTRWFHLTPGRFVIGLLAVEGLLWLSDKFGWLGWHKGYAVLTGVASVGVAMLLMIGWFGVAMVFRRRFQFSIRSLLVLTVVVALPCSWMAVEMKEARQQREVIFAIENAGGTVHYHWEVDTDSRLLPNPGPPGPAPLRRLLGKDFLDAVVVVDLGKDFVTCGTGQRFDPLPVSDAVLEQLVGLPQFQRLGLRRREIADAGFERITELDQLKEIDLSGTNVTNATLGRLRRLRCLEELALMATQVNDDGLEQLKGLPHLRSLFLDGRRITDIGLKHLSRLPLLTTLGLELDSVSDASIEYLKVLTELRRLDLAGTQLTDTGLEGLGCLAQLQELDLLGTKVTEDGIMTLQQALPNCEIVH
jgi:hypothetical protein